MTRFYANIVLQGAQADAVAAFLKTNGAVAYLTAGASDSVVVFHEDFDTQERLAAGLSEKFTCPALLAMVFNATILLYHCYDKGSRVDAYISSPHEGLELDGPAPAGDAAILCATFDVERSIASVDRVLRRPTKSDSDYALAVNRHGELLRALKLPLFAAGAGYAAIDAGELPHGTGFDPRLLRRIG